MNQVKPKVSCIIPAYNEEKTVAKVVKTCLAAPEVNEVIVVNDGSTDKTGKALQPFGQKIKLITFAGNKGKSEAIVAGIKKAKGEILIFLDADLRGLERKHIKNLISPIKKDVADIVLAIREKDKKIFRLLTGERAYKRQDLLPHLGKMRQTGFGSETYLNAVFWKKRILTFVEEGVLHHKTLTKRAPLAVWKEALEVAQEMARQNNLSLNTEALVEAKVFNQIIQKYQTLKQRIKKEKIKKNIERLIEPLKSPL